MQALRKREGWGVGGKRHVRMELRWTEIKAGCYNIEQEWAKNGKEMV